MTSDNNQIKQIIDKKIYPDVANIIKNFLFDKCSLCNQDGYPENFDTGVKDKKYCMSCQEHPSIVKRCCRCHLFFEKFKNIYFCRSCSGLCELYCNNCFDLTQSPFHIDGPHYFTFWSQLDIPDMIDVGLDSEINVDTLSD